MKIKIIIAAVLSIVSSLSFAAGEVLKLNTSGTQYCPGQKPFVFNPANDIDLFVRINDEFSATLYRDANLTVPVADLFVFASLFSSNKASFSASSGTLDEYIAVVGTLKFDTNGEIQSLKGTLLRRGFLNFCHAKGTVKGKRIN